MSKNTFFTGDPGQFKDELARYIDMFGVTSEDMKNLSVAALIGQMMGLTTDNDVLGRLQAMLSAAGSRGRCAGKRRQGDQGSNAELGQSPTAGESFLADLSAPHIWLLAVRWGC